MRASADHWRSIRSKGMVEASASLDTENPVNATLAVAISLIPS